MGEDSESLGTQLGDQDVVLESRRAGEVHEGSGKVSHVWGVNNLGKKHVRPALAVSNFQGLEAAVVAGDKAWRYVDGGEH